MNKKGEALIVVPVILALLIGIGHYNYKNNGWGPQNTKPDTCIEGIDCVAHGPISEAELAD